MVRLLSWVFSASLLMLLCVVNSSVVEGRSFVERATDAEICGAANYYICSDGNTCCPDGFLCQDQGCIKAPDNTSNDPTTTEVVTITVTPTPKPPPGPPLGTGVIAGIAAGGAVSLIAAAVAIFFCMRKRKIGKEVLKAYEDPRRNMYDQVVVEGKRISVVPVGPTQQRRQTQTNLPPPSEAQELANMDLPPPSEAQELANMEVTAVGLKPEGQYPQQQPQQYQPYRQQQQTYYNQNQEQIQQSTELSADQAYSPPSPQAPAPYVPEPIPAALRVGSPVSPIRADSMGLIPVAADTTDGGQHPYQFSPVPSTTRHHSATFPPPAHHHQNTEPIPQSTQSQSPVYYQPQTPSPPPQEMQIPERYQSPQTYQTPQAAYQQYQQEDVHRIPSPPNSYSQYPQYEQYPEKSPSPVSPVQQQNHYSMHGHNPPSNNNSNNSNWGYGR